MRVGGANRLPDGTLRRSRLTNSLRLATRGVLEGFIRGAHGNIEAAAKLAEVHPTNFRGMCRRHDAEFPYLPSLFGIAEELRAEAQRPKPKK